MAGMCTQFLSLLKCFTLCTVGESSTVSIVEHHIEAAPAHFSDL
jgi:hypothetical protein